VWNEGSLGSDESVLGGLLPLLGAVAAVLADDAADGGGAGASAPVRTSPEREHAHGAAIKRRPSTQLLSWGCTLSMLAHPAPPGNF
jgi:hypothetical protein